MCLLCVEPSQVLQLIVDRERRTSPAMHKGPGAPRTLHGMNASAMKRRHSCNAFLTDNGPCLSPRLEASPAAHQDQHSARRQFLRYVQGEVALPSSGSTTLSFPRYLHAATRVDFPLVRPYPIRSFFCHVYIRASPGSAIKVYSGTPCSPFSFFFLALPCRCRCSTGRRRCSSRGCRPT